MKRLKLVVYPILSVLLRPLRERIVSLAYSRARSAGGASRERWSRRAIALRQHLYGDAPVIRLAHLDDGSRLWVDVAEWEGGNLFFGRPYERAERQIARRLITEGATVIDVGANVGVYTLLASRAAGPRGRVHAFEPASATFELLRRNVRANAASNCVLERLAVSDTDGEADLVLDRESGLASLGRTGRGRPLASERVRTVTLDAYARERSVRGVRFVKIDVEGFEGHVLRGARELLAREREVAVLAELEPLNYGPLGFDIDAVFAWMRSLGFSGWRIAREGSLLPVGAAVSGASNVVFVRPGTTAAALLASLG